MVAPRWGGADREDGGLPGGATLREATRGWVLVDDGDRRRLGVALAWAQRAGVGELHLVVDSAPDPATAGYLAWQAAELEQPPAVWSLQGRELQRAAVAAPPPDPALPAGAAHLAGMVEEVGAEVVVEHGVLRAEIAGLEIARAVPDAGGAWRLAVGVGAADRAALAELRPGEDPRAALGRVADAVGRHRRPGAPAHPANLLCRERWLRSVLVARPDLVGVGELTPSPPVLPRTDLRAPAAAPAVGDGVVVVASTGVDLDLVPAAAAARAVADPTARLVIAVPAGDDHPLTRSLAGALARPAQVVTVPRDWPAQLGTAPGAHRPGIRRHRGPAGAPPVG